MDTKSMITELEAKRRQIAQDLNKIDTAIEALKGVNGLLPPEPAKVQVIRKTKQAIKHTLEVPHPVDFAVSYIRKAGKEVGVKELFAAYNKATQREFKTNDEKKTHYNRFYAAVNVLGKKRGILTSKVYHFEGVGKEAYFNVTSAITLQTGKVVQNPNVEITEVKSQQ